MNVCERVKKYESPKEDKGYYYYLFIHYLYGVYGTCGHQRRRRDHIISMRMVVSYRQARKSIEAKKERKKKKKLIEG